MSRPYHSKMTYTYAGVLLISAATLLLEVSLTRVFAVAQWYHFAFMAVSLALLGYGASGSFLSVWGQPWRSAFQRLLGAGAILFALTTLGSYMVANYLPFDSFRIGWDHRQLIYLVAYYFALTVPFFFSGLCLGLLLAGLPERVGTVYASSLVGSALGAVLALVALGLVGGAGSVMLAAGLGALAAASFAAPYFRPGILLGLAMAALAVGLLVRLPAGLEIQMSPYKALRHLLRYPDARLAFSAGNAYSRVDVVESRSIRLAPGLSFAYPAAPPPQLALAVDGEDPAPIVRAEMVGDFTAYLPEALAYALRPGGRALVVEPRGGLGVLTALKGGAAEVLALEGNPLVVEAVRDRFGAYAGHIYADRRVQVVAENPRSYLWRRRELFDIVHLPLNDAFKPVVSGAYSLTEDYLHTVEAIADYLGHLTPQGLLSITRWLQLPPSEELRAAALAAEALRQRGIPDASRHIVALRSWSTVTLLVKPTPFTPEEIALVRRFAAERQFDLVYFSGLRPEEANRFNVFPEDQTHRAMAALLESAEPAAFYRQYPYDVSPPTDDRPFFFHFFRWGQAEAVLRGLGKTWQPFGGAGYLVIVALLAVAFLLAAVLILLPLAFLPRGGGPVAGAWRYLAYFTLLGFGYLFIEIPLMQRLMLFLEQPTYAIAVVLGGLLFFSGLGSLVSARLPLRAALLALAVGALIYPPVLTALLRALPGLVLEARMALALVGLSPLGFLMGVPFPAGLRRVHASAPPLVPWVWGVNGFASVLSAILAALLAVSFGFSAVLGLAGVAYALALAAIWGARSPELVNRQNF